MVDRSVAPRWSRTVHMDDIDGQAGNRVSRYFSCCDLVFLGHDNLLIPLHAISTTSDRDIAGRTFLGWTSSERSEERRVGKECRSRWSRWDGRKTDSEK